MSEYSYILIWIAVMAVISYLVTTNYYIEENGHIRNRERIVFAFLVFFPVFFLTVFGTPVGDVPLYLHTFHDLPQSFWGLSGLLKGESIKGPGFVTLGVLVKALFGDNEIIYRLTIGLIHSIPVVLIFRKYSDHYMMSIYLFVATACHVGWMMNGLRQFMAVTIIFMATPLLIKRRYIPMIMIILLASTVHSSAIFMIPVIFIVQGQAFNKRTILYMLIAIIATYIFSKNLALSDYVLQGTEYEGAITSWVAMGDDGVNPIRVVVNAVPAIMAFWGRRYIWDEDDPSINIFVNMSFITLGLYLVAMVTSGIIIGRMPIYTSLYNCILIPYLIDKIFEKNSATLVKFLMIGFYLVYYRFEVGF